MKHVLPLLLLAICLHTLTGCSKKIVRAYPQKQFVSDDGGSRQESAKSKSFQFEDAEVMGYLDNPTPVYIVDAEPPAAKIAQQEQSSVDHKMSPKQQFKSSEGIQQAQQQMPGKMRGKTKRMITYDGNITSRSTKPDSLIALAVALAESLKGYVEMRNNMSVTLRIPVAKFGVLYDSLLKLGEVIDYQKSSEDITDAFRDTDLRVTVLEKTIERYVKLIRLVKDEKEKISLLKEIERLRGELEELRVQKSVLALRAQFAKVHYIVQQRSTGFAGVIRTDQLQGFEWLGFLDPINIYQFGKDLKLSVPEGMVRLEDRSFWMAQSPTGTRVWTARIRNAPQGTSDFWIDAITCKLKERFPLVDTSTAVGYRFIHCTPLPGDNYRYSVGVKIVGNSIQVIQCFFPDVSQENRYFNSITKALAQKGGAS